MRRIDIRHHTAQHRKIKAEIALRWNSGTRRDGEAELGVKGMRRYLGAQRRTCSANTGPATVERPYQFSDPLVVALHLYSGRRREGDVQFMRKVKLGAVASTL